LEYYYTSFYHSEVCVCVLSRVCVSVCCCLILVRPAVSVLLRDFTEFVQEAIFVYLFIQLSILFFISIRNCFFSYFSFLYFNFVAFLYLMSFMDFLSFFFSLLPALSLFSANHYPFVCVSIHMTFCVSEAFAVVIIIRIEDIFARRQGRPFGANGSQSSPFRLGRRRGF
jgi:hypothetical protein